MGMLTEAEDTTLVTPRDTEYSRACSVPNGLSGQAQDPECPELAG